MGRRYRRAALAILLIVLSLFLIYWYLSGYWPGVQKEPSANAVQPLEGNLTNQVDRMLAEDGSYETSLPPKRCHWLRPTHNGTHMLLEIITYNNSETCGGQVLNRRHLVLRQPLSIHGKCLCGTSCQFRTETINNTQYLRQQGCQVEE